VEASTALYDPAVTLARRPVTTDAFGVSANPWITR
jgi:hypothetical protein